MECAAHRSVAQNVPVNVYKSVCAVTAVQMVLTYTLVQLERVENWADATKIISMALLLALFFSHF